MKDLSLNLFKTTRLIVEILVWNAFSFQLSFVSPDPFWAKLIKTFLLSSCEDVRCCTSSLIEKDVGKVSDNKNKWINSSRLVFSFAPLQSWLFNVTRRIHILKYFIYYVAMYGVVIFRYSYFDSRYPCHYQYQQLHLCGNTGNPVTKLQMTIYFHSTRLY